MPIIRHMPVSRVRKDCNWLADFRSDVTSQIGQDGILQKIFEVIGTESKFCVEFGAWDGKYLSNTWRLTNEAGWAAILIEANEEKCRQILQNRPPDRVRALNQTVAWDGDGTFDKIMEREHAPDTIDLVSIDIDGNDWHVWNSIQKWRPRVVLIEFNPTIPNDVYFVQDADMHISQGSSLSAMIELGRAKGYSLVCADQWDAFFVPDELYPKFSIPDNSIDNMHSPSSNETKIFQGFDGTLYTAGCQRLLWLRVDFQADSLQLLDDSRRRYIE